MKIHIRMPRLFLTLLMLLAIQGVSIGQNLYDVVISLTERQRVVNQAAKVREYLSSGEAGKAMDSIEWIGIGTAPTLDKVEKLNVEGRVALLDQAVSEFERLKFQFLNSSPHEFAAGSVVGTLKPYLSGDFDPLAHATAGNLDRLVEALAHRVRNLQIIMWPSAFRNRGFTDDSTLWEESAEDENGGHVLKIMPEGVAPNWQPTKIGPRNPVVDPLMTDVSFRFESWIEAYGDYQAQVSNSSQLTKPWQSSGLKGFFAEEAQVCATVPGGGEDQVDGTVFVLRRSIWHQIDIETSPACYDVKQGGYVVEGSGKSGGVMLLASPPMVSVNGSWVTSVDDGNGTIEKKFVAGGYQYLKASTINSGEPGHSDDYDDSYERNWKIGCNYYSVFKPAFVLGLNSPGLASKFDAVKSASGGSPADGNLIIQPRPDLLFGIQVGVGLTGKGSGYISAGMIEGWGALGGPHGGGTIPFLSRDDLNPMIRFDSTYWLRFAGSGSDYHVVYDNPRGAARIQKLPADGMGWPPAPGANQTKYDTSTLYRAWDSPRLKQVVGKDLVADIEYTGSHYGGYTVRMFRRPDGEGGLVPGKPLDVSGLTPIRIWSFSNPNAEKNAHPAGPEALQAIGSKAEKYEIRANHTLSDNGRGPVEDYYWGWNWWWSKQGVFSWTLKFTQGTTEKFRKEIKIVNSVGENSETQHEVTVSEFLSGKRTSSRSSTTLNPFVGDIPKG